MIKKTSFKNTFILTFIVLCSATTFAQYNPASDPNNDGNWEYKANYSDEFNGNSLDESKWSIKGKNGNYTVNAVYDKNTSITWSNNWKGRAPSQYDAANVKVSGGKLIMTSKWDENFNFSGNDNGGNGDAGMPYGGYNNKDTKVTAAGIVSKNMFLYGYWEVKCKAAKGPISSSFWSTGKDGEIDVFEHWGRNPSDIKKSAERIHTSFHDWRRGSSTYGNRIWDNEHYMDFNVSDDYHIYGMDWNENYIKLYLDGRLIRTITKVEMGDKWVAYNPQTIWLDMELFEWEEPVYKWVNNVRVPQYKKSDFTSTSATGGLDFEIEYVRVWQRNGGNATDNRPNLIENGGFENGTTSWTKTGSATAVSNNSYKGNKAVYLGSSLGTVSQTIAVKPNTTYMVSAWAKMPDTNMSNIWANSWIDITQSNGTKRTKIQWYKPTYARIAYQFTTGSNVNSVTIKYYNYNKQAYADEFKLIELDAEIGDKEEDNEDGAAPAGTLIVNPDFEQGESGWNLEGEASIVNDNNNTQGGTNAGYINGDGSINQIILLDANTEYTVSCYGKVGAVGQNVILGVTNVDIESGFVKNVSFTSTSYEKKSVTFTTGATAQSYKIWFWNNAGGSYYVDDFEMNDPNDGTVNVETPEAIGNECKIYPNPASSEITIEANRAKTIALYNMEGNIIKTEMKTSEPYILPVSDLKSGMYIMRIVYDNKSVTKRITIK